MATKDSVAIIAVPECPILDEEEIDCEAKGLYNENSNNSNKNYKNKMMKTPERADCNIYNSRMVSRLSSAHKQKQEPLVVSAKINKKQQSFDFKGRKSVFNIPMAQDMHFSDLIKVASKLQLRKVDKSPGGTPRNKQQHNNGHNFLQNALYQRFKHARGSIETPKRRRASTLPANTNLNIQLQSNNNKHNSVNNNNTHHHCSEADEWAVHSPSHFNKPQQQSQQPPQQGEQQQQQEQQIEQQELAQPQPLQENAFQQFQLLQQKLIQQQQENQHEHEQENADIVKTKINNNVDIMPALLMDDVEDKENNASMAL
jgi:hypothetical protein